MITDDMTRHIAKVVTFKHKDSYETVIKYWLNIGKYAGFRERQ